MKTTRGRRWLSLLLTLAMCLTLTPAVFAHANMTVTLNPTTITVKASSSQELTATVSNAPDTDVQYAWSSSDNNIAAIDNATTTSARVSVRGSGAGSARITLTVTSGGQTATATCNVTVEAARSLTLTPNDNVIMDVGGYQEFKATPTPSDERITWRTENDSVVEVQNTNGTTNNVYARAPGETTISATISGSASDNTVTRTVNVAVSGLVLADEDKRMTLQENATKPLPLPERYGNAANGQIAWQSSNPSVAQISGNSVAGRGPGTATITGWVGGNYQVSFTVTVSADVKVTIEAGTIESGGRLDFSTLLTQLNSQVEGGLSHLTGIYTTPEQGTLYYQYSSPDEPNAGVAQRDSYYYSPGPGQRGLSGITFIPNENYGGQVTINYTGVSNTNEVYNGRILLTVKQADTAVITLSATNRTPAWFNSTDFNRICQQKTGAELDYVTFSLPAANRGTLYADYISADNYGSRVSTTAQYRLKDLDGIVFVPGTGVTGTVTIYYTAQSKASASRPYSGTVSITVTRDDIAGSGGPVYNIAQNTTQLFDDYDFDDYCNELIVNGRLSYVQFTSLPSADQGTLYLNYRSTGNRGTLVRTDLAYYYGTRTPRLDQITFVPVEDFTGTVRIPFTGWDENGNRFTGNVEINVYGASGSGNIHYTCAPGRTVSFTERDFRDLCDDLTGRTLNYIVLQDLPGSSQGYLYHSSTRISSTGTRYYYSTSGSYRIRNLSFRASSSFSGSVDIPFTGYASNGSTFSGVITIDSRGGGSGYTDLSYKTDSNTAVVFDQDDFNDICWDETGYNLSSVKFSVPSTSRGDLYRSYRSSTNKGTRISSSSTSVSRSALDQVAFVPASGYVGTVQIEYTATASGSGGTYTGTITIDVERPGAAVTVRYSTRTSPVNFYSDDFRRSGYTLSSIRFSSLPSSSEGQLYFRYTSPTEYSGVASTSTTYRAGTSGSNLISDLTFVPKAGFTGTVTLPYVGTNSNNSTFDGEVVITVLPTTTSSRFNDLGGYSDQQRAAVEYIYENGVTVGISETQYGPELNITRGDFALMVYNAFGFTPAGSSWVFNDVPPNMYYAQAVNTLYTKGIVSGVGSGDYAPTANVAREDAICMVQRAMRAVGWSANDGAYSILSSYNDASSVSGYAQGAMAMAIQQGYLPVTGRNLNPRQALTRIDMAQILYRVMTTH